MANVAAGLAPVDFGSLGFSIVVSEKRTRRVQKMKRREGVQVAMGPGSGPFGTLNYAAFVEFGTVDTAAQAYMRPAWDGGKRAMLDRVIADLAKQIDAAVGRVARKQARAARAR